MRDHAFYLDQLTPREALDLLAAAVAAGEIKHLSSFKVEVSESAFGVSAALVLPEATEKGIKAQRNRQESLNVLIEAYSVMKKAQPRRMPDRNEGLPLDRGLAWLLLNSGQDKERGEGAGEFLLVGSEMDHEAAATTFEHLRFHATHTRIAAAETERGQIYLFNVLDDPGRHSSFQSIMAGEAFSALNVLVGHVVDPYRVFLPPEVHPEFAALENFVTILRAVPTLLDVSSLAEHGPLVAINPLGAGKNLGETTQALYQLYYLGSLTFHGQARFTPSPSHGADFKVHHLTDSQAALANLGKTIRSVVPDVGYRLELRPTRYLEFTEVQRLRLLERQADVEYKLAYLESLSAPRPILLRFTERQLPALAEVIRSFPLKVLREGYPKYGFQAQNPLGPETTDHAAGLHYLYLEPEDAVFSELDPLLHFSELEADSPMRFWLDPFWARFYHGDHNECLIFVPERNAMFPTMHGWQTDRMDAYMREVLQEWFLSGQQTALPERPIYIFETRAGTTDEISISVLDKDQFQPLHTRLGWINDHLVIADALDLDRFIGEMAQDITRVDLALEVKRKASSLEAELDQLMTRTGERIAGKLGELTEVVTEEFNRVLNQTHETTVYLKDLYDYLQELGQVRDEAKEASNASFQALVKTQGAHRDLASYIDKLEKDIGQEVEKAGKAKVRAMNRVKHSVKELSTTHHELRRKLMDLLRIGKG